MLGLKVMPAVFGIQSFRFTLFLIEQAKSGPALQDRTKRQLSGGQLPFYKEPRIRMRGFKTEDF